MIMLNRVRAFAASLLIAGTAVMAQEPMQEPSLSLNVYSRAFFDNNEFHSPLCKGYTLPGFRLTPTLKYTFSPAAEIEAGAYMMYYWGSKSYPDCNYFGLPDYSDKSNKGLHALPYLRAKLTSKFGLQVIIGNLVNPTHGLIEPMYAQERLLTADPEAGIQLRYSHPRISADVWVDWRTFIYNHSPYGENFVFGATAKAMLTRPGSRWQLSLPVQVLAEHLGGEIDDTDLGVSTLLNAAAGLRLEYTGLAPAVNSLGIEAYGLISKQVAGSLWTLESGNAIYGQAFIETHGFRAGIGAFHARKFVSLCGLPLFGALSNIDSSVLNSPTTFCANASYTYTFAPGVELQAYASLYSLLSCDRYMPAEATPIRQKSTTSYIFGATVKAEISQPLWKKKQAAHAAATIM